MTNAARFHTIPVCNEEDRTMLPFTVPKRYTDLVFISEGAQGAVVSAWDSITSRKVAIKKLQGQFDSQLAALRAFREVVLLSSLSHPNIIKFKSLFTPQESLEEFEDIYLIMEFLGSTLEEVVGKVNLDHRTLSKFIYQTLCAVSHLHKKGIIHRDLKPCNIVVNEQFELKVIDFGHARVITRTPAERMSGYVVTRYYRAPEVILKLKYCEKVDVWSIGCIIAQMINGTVLFQGRDKIDQWKKIVGIMGTPNEFIAQLDPAIAEGVRLGTPIATPKSLEDIIPDPNFIETSEDSQRNWTAQNARNLISRMLVIDPNQRCSIAQALEDPYVRCWADDRELNARLEQVNERGGSGYDRNLDAQALSVAELKAIIFEEVKRIESAQDIFGGL